MTEKEELQRQKKREYLKIYNKTRRAYYNERLKQWQAKNPEKVKASNSKYYSENKEKIRQAVRERCRQLRLEILMRLGNRCVACGFDDVRALCIDHLNGGGTQERKRRDRQGYLKAIKEAIDEGHIEYQVLCANCHTIKHCGDE